jgi:hypothetical protein
LSVINGVKNGSHRSGKGIDRDSDVVLSRAVVIAILFIGSGLMFRLAVRLFQYGSIAYTNKVNIKTALSNGKKTAPPVATSTQ